VKWEIYNDGELKAEVTFEGREYHGNIYRNRKNKWRWIGGTTPGQTASEFRTITEQYLMRLVEKYKNTPQ
jgi:hypothetical protein